MDNFESVTNQKRIAEYLQGAQIKNIWMGEITDHGYYAEIELQDGSIFYVDDNEIELRIKKEIPE